MYNISMDLADNFLKLINEIEPSALALSIFGVLLVAISFVRSAQAVWVANGSLCLAASLAIRILGGGGLAQVFIMIFLQLLLITLAFIATTRLSKYGWIIRMPLSKVGEGVMEVEYLDDREE
jgi:hypothetical protein